ncbi:MAG TPA: hypothetical protein PLC35_04285 [Methanosarcina vacuolata]|nr:hypothetical protein [Methanosarcina vacuolata]
MAAIKGVSENKTITTNSKKQYIIGIGIDPETVLRLDADGNILNFEMKDKFLALSDAVIAKLSRENRVRYEISKEFHDSWRGDEHEKLVEEFKVDPTAKGSAQEKLTAEAPKGMRLRWVAPHNIERYRGMGGKVASPDEVKSFLGPKGGHHEGVALGQTEWVAMLFPEEISKAREERKVAGNEEKAGFWQKSGVNELGETGFDASKEDRRSWSEIPPESVG